MLQGKILAFLVAPFRVSIEIGCLAHLLVISAPGSTVQASTTSSPKPPEAHTQVPLPAMAASLPGTSTPAKTAPDPFAQFPKFQPSTTNCFGKEISGCLIAKTDLLTVSNWYLNNAKAQKFELTRTNDSDAGKTIFEATKDGKIYYLSLLSDGDSTVILLGPEKLLDLNILKEYLVAVPSDYIELLYSLVPEDDDRYQRYPDQYDFSNPDAFFNDLTYETIRLEVALVPQVVPDNPVSLFTMLEAKLRGIFQEVESVGMYGGGNLYKLKRGRKIFYMNLVPNKGGDGTIVVTWITDPR